MVGVGHGELMAPRMAILISYQNKKIIIIIHEILTIFIGLAKPPTSNNKRNISIYICACISFSNKCKLSNFILR